MLSSESGKATAAIGASPNALAPIVFSPLPKVTDARPSQSKNACSPMLSTESGNVTETSELQSLNADSPMLTSVSGRITLLKISCSKALSPISRTVLPPISAGMTRFSISSIFVQAVILTPPSISSQVKTGSGMTKISVAL